MNATAIGLIRVYQRLVSPLLRRRGVMCLHHPSCSEYAVLALRKYPLLRAIGVIWRRYRDCQPFSGRPYIDYP